MNNLFSYTDDLTRELAKEIDKDIELLNVVNKQGQFVGCIIRGVGENAGLMSTTLCETEVDAIGEFCRINATEGDG